MSDIIDNTLKDNSRTLAPAAVGSQVALMSIVSVSTVVPCGVQEHLLTCHFLDRHRYPIQLPSSEKQGTPPLEWECGHGIFVACLELPVFQNIYEPKVKYHEGAKPPPRISDSLFGWLPPLIRTKEPELLDKIGLDAV